MTTNNDNEERELKRAQHQALLEAFGTEVYDRIPLQFPVTFAYKDPRTNKEYASTKIEAPDTNGRMNVYLNGEGASEKMIQNVEILVGPLMDKGFVKELHFHTNFEPQQKTKANTFLDGL